MYVLQLYYSQGFVLTLEGDVDDGDGGHYDDAGRRGQRRRGGAGPKERGQAREGGRLWINKWKLNIETGLKTHVGRCLMVHYKALPGRQRLPTVSPSRPGPPSVHIAHTHTSKVAAASDKPSTGRPSLPFRFTLH